METEITTKVIYCSLSDLTEKEKSLIEAAKTASYRAYAPYSRFSVGAALLLSNGEIVLGSNQENAAYPLCLCAERNALFTAATAWPDAAPVTMAIAARQADGFTEKAVTPCGSCRQALWESARRHGCNIGLLLYGRDEIVKTDAAGLLPLAF